MKNRIRVFAPLLMAIVIAIFSSCQRDEALKPAGSQKKLSSTVSPTPDSQLEQKLQNTVTLGLLDLSNNQYFRTMVHELVADTFDGYNNTLLKTIETAWNAKGNNFYDAFKTSLTAHAPDFKDFPVFTTNDSIAMAIRGLVLENADTFYTQIYIANFNLITGSPAKPAIAPSCFLPGSEEVPVFDINPSTGGGTVRPEPEPTSGTEPIWIVSVNETTGGNSVSGSSSTTAPTSTNAGRRELRLLACRVHNLNEDWINGLAEIQIYMKQINASNPSASDGLYKPTAYWPESERFRTGTGSNGDRHDYIRRLERDEENEEWNYPNYDISPWLATNMAQHPIGPYHFAEGNTLFCVLFERDVTAGDDNRSATSPSTGYSISYESYDEAFMYFDIIYSAYDDDTNWHVIDLDQSGNHIGLIYRNF